MPSFSSTRAAVVFSDGAATFFPPRFSSDPARIRFTSGMSGFSILGTPIAPRIERLQRFEPSNNAGSANITGGNAKTTFRAQVVQQKNAEGIEAAFASLQSQVIAVEQVLNLTREALRQATEVARRVSVNGSYTNPTGVVSATSAGVVTIAAHERVYIDGSNTAVAVDGGTLTGFAPGATVSVFYEDNTLAGGAVAYQSSLGAVSQEGNTHIVGRVTIPQSGDPPATGGGPTAPGYVPPPGDTPEEIDRGDRR